jgi:Holliday junction resolvasome RuvABC endonuclease subunit
LFVIGIDFSIQFPAVCICKDFKSFHWIACVNSNLTKAHKKLLEDVQLEHSTLEFIFLPPKDLKKETYSATERAKLENYSRLVDTLVNRVNEIVKPESSTGPIIVSIEGVAYGAQGNALIDICQATGMLRKTMLDTTLNGHPESLFIFSPGELKNAIGAKGNAGKYDVYLQFKADPMIADGSSLHQAINKYEDQIVKDQNIKSPFTDMIDSYLAVLKIHNTLKDS